MNGIQYAIAAYIVGLGLMVGYGALLWIESRMLNRRRGDDGER